MTPLTTRPAVDVETGDDPGGPHAADGTADLRVRRKADRAPRHTGPAHTRHADAVDLNQRVLLIRHGETAWSSSRRHTGRSDIPLTDDGREQADRLRGRLPLRDFGLVLTSPADALGETARRAGLVVDDTSDDLVEWDYGEAEGRTTADIHEERPGWDIWDDGVTDGETVDHVAERADRVIARARRVRGDVALVGHAHLFRVLGARWVGLPPWPGAT